MDQNLQEKRETQCVYGGGRMSARVSLTIMHRGRGIQRDAWEEGHGVVVVMVWK